MHRFAEGPDRVRQLAWSVGLGLLVAIAAGCGDGRSGGLVDDWVYAPTDEADDAMNMAGGSRAGTPAPSPGAVGADSGELGFSVGGAKGIENFRRNIEEGFLPLASDITYEGMFYGYSFDTAKSQPCTALFCPSYAQLLSADPLSGDDERFLSVGLNSGLTEASFARKKLNLVVVLDISGSMGSPFDAYYYDDPSKAQEPASTKSKMQVANEALVAMLDHLAPGDRFGMVLFESQAFLAKPLSDVATTDMAAIKSHILKVTDRGGTNMEAGYELGAALMGPMVGADPAVYENRIIFLTDAMPNTGDTSEGSLLGMVEAAASQRVFTTFVGIGLDFHTGLVEAITKVKGANYYAVHSEESFKQRMDEEFDFMVTPLVFDLKLAFASSAFAISAVYGSPEADQATGVLMHVNTLFPSKVVDGETKGGVVILKLAQTGPGAAIQLTASYRDRTDQTGSSSASLTFDAVAGVAPNTGIRKAVLLARFVRLMKQWVEAERAKLGAPPAGTDLGQWERRSVPLTVSPEHKAEMKKLLPHLQSEAAALGDQTLDQEVALLQKLIAWAD